MLYNWHIFWMVGGKGAPTMEWGVLCVMSSLSRTLWLVSWPTRECPRVGHRTPAFNVDKLIVWKLYNSYFQEIVDLQKQGEQKHVPGDACLRGRSSNTKCFENEMKPEQKTRLQQAQGQELREEDMRVKEGRLEQWKADEQLSNVSELDEAHAQGIKLLTAQNGASLGMGFEMSSDEVLERFLVCWAPPHGKSSSI